MLLTRSRAHTDFVRILLAEDDRQLAQATARGLEQSGFAVDIAYDGDEALEKAEITGYDVVVLDRDMPGTHGDAVCAVLAGGPSRVLMLTALDELDDRVHGLNLGADDYLTKPFALHELVARIRALGRRSVDAVSPVLVIGDCTVDPGLYTATRAGNAITLTPKEFGILEVLMRASPGPVSAEELIERVWDEHVDPFTNVVRVVMVTLCRKLGQPPIIETIKGVGYRIPDRP